MRWIPAFLLLMACTEEGEGPVGVNEIASVPDPWLEIYNATDEPVSLDGWQLDLAGQTWDLPAVEVPADGMTMLFLDGQVDQGELHAPFELSITGGPLDVFDDSGAQVQAISVPEMLEGQSYGRIPDGSANWQVIETPSPGDLNGSE